MAPRWSRTTTGRFEAHRFWYRFWYRLQQISASTRVPKRYFPPGSMLQRTAPPGPPKPGVAGSSPVAPVLRKTPRAPRVRQFEAFISYSHTADEKLAKGLQRTLNRIARPSYKWWQWWPPRVFRDQTGLIPTDDLAAAIERAPLASDSFVLLASPLAAASPWVDREVATWRAKKPLDRLFIALTEGALAWDDARGDFDAVHSTALPPSLRGAFEAEPLWVDFTGVREDRPFARDPGFLDGAATLAAAIRRTDKDALVGEDVRQRRRTRQLVVGAVATLTLLAVAATIAAIYAFVQRNHANERARIALSRQYAAQAIAALEVDPEQSLGRRGARGETETL